MYNFAAHAALSLQHEGGRGGLAAAPRPLEELETLTLLVSALMARAVMAARHRDPRLTAYLPKA